MKRLLFASEVDLADPEAVGIIKKIRGQIKVFRKYFDTYLLLSKKGKPFLASSDDFLQISDNTEAIKSPYTSRSISERISWYRYLKKIAEEFDYIYLRSFVPDPFSILYIRKVKAFKILEIATQYSAALREIRSRLREHFSLKRYMAYLSSKILFKSFIRSFDLVVCIGDCEEIIKKNSKDFLSISNGMDVEEIPLKPCSDDEEGLYLVGVANLSFWHGYDRIIRGMKIYYDREKDDAKKVYFLIVGEGRGKHDLKELVSELGLDKYVLFLGVKLGRDLDKVFEKAHIGIGSLAGHRKSLKKACELKIREYCSRGVPFIIGYDDFDFPPDFPYMMRVSSDDTPIDIEKVIAFYDNLKSKYPNFRLDMRRYAERYLSWEVKMKPLILKLKGK
ncbi:MAG TPA: glycosyl transferase family 1 [Methanomicrobia archaeon]|nr:glycosyl transferase family 1 [Methanomicrobia archaeon]